MSSSSKICPSDGSLFSTIHLKFLHLPLSLWHIFVAYLAVQPKHVLVIASSTLVMTPARASQGHTQSFLTLKHQCYLLLQVFSAIEDASIHISQTTQLSELPS